MAKLWLLVLIISAWFLCGCQRREDRSHETPPATSSAKGRPVSAPATTQAATRPAFSQLVINDRLVEFPRTRLRVQQKKPALRVLLFSDDPKQAIDDSYSGNSFYLEIELPEVELEQLATSTWTYRAVSAQQADTPNGIFLDGGRKQLQPFDVKVVFGRAGDKSKERSNELTAELSGQFLLFHTRENVPAQTAWVRGLLSAELEKSSEK